MTAARLRTFGTCCAQADEVRHAAADQLGEQAQLGRVAARMWVDQVDRQGRGLPLRNQLDQAAFLDIAGDYPGRADAGAEPGERGTAQGIDCLLYTSRCV